MKKVLLIIIDALASRVVDPAMDQGRLPNLRRLRAAADVRTNSIAVFPSITPAATTSLITGCYPGEHGISGAYWYIPDEKRVVYFGYDFWAILENGIGSFFDEFLLKLNTDHLRVKTLFQRVEEQGLSAASLNYLIYHGDHHHDLKLPPLQRLLPDAISDLLPSAAAATTVDGPTLLYFGDLVQTPLSDGSKLSFKGGITNRLGFTDDSSADMLVHMLDNDVLPDLTVAYFPGNDSRSHEVGPERALDHLEEVDQRLGDVYAAFGGLERMLDQVAVVLTGDHSQSDVLPEEEQPGIRLDELLESFEVADAGTAMSDEDDLVVCPNLRAAQIYFHTPRQDYLERVVAELMRDERIDQVLWSAEFFEADGRGFHVVSRARGRVHVWPGDSGPDHATDEYGNVWSWTGNLEAVDGHVSDGTGGGDADGVITFGDYPNAFERIAQLLNLDVAGHLWVTSKPGYELCLEHTLIHAGGGSHGSLHVLDSVSPLWVAGAPDDVGPIGDAQVQNLRSVDLVPICLAILGIAG